MANKCKKANTEKEEGCKNPFEEADIMSDVTLVVENRKLFVHRTLLALYSPVFQRMFFSEFVENTTTEIELPGKNHEDVLNFLLQLYPVHSFRKITDDTLPGILTLADEYMVEHLCKKCKQYLKDKSTSTNGLTIDQVLLFLLLADRCRFQALKEKMTKEVVRREPLEISKSRFYREIDSSLMRDIFCTQSMQITQFRNHMENISARESQCYRREARLEQNECHTNRFKRDYTNLQNYNYFLQIYLFLSVAIGMICLLQWCSDYDSELTPDPSAETSIIQSGREEDL